MSSGDFLSPSPASESLAPCRMIEVSHNTEASVEYLEIVYSQERSLEHQMYQCESVFSLCFPTREKFIEISRGKKPHILLEINLSWFPEV